MTQPVLDHLAADHEHAVARLGHLLSIPSVSTDPAYREHVHQAARWIDAFCAELGMSVSISQPPGPDGKQGHPIVLAKTTPKMVEPGATHRVLFYGHYDVQPPDPVAGWTSPPFEPTVRNTPDGREQAIYARGASDDKGQVMCFLEALRAYHATETKLPCHVTVLIEGEEECGSVSLPAFFENHADQLETDDHTVCVVSDTGLWETPGERRAYRPAITYGLRGIVYLDLKLHGPNRDLHSGVYGGAVANPINELVRVLGKLLDDDHRITIPGFYDGLSPLDDSEQEAWNQLNFDEHAFTAEVGAVPFGEKDQGTLHRRWSRPSCDINGIYGGYMGEGAKTVLPSFAGAKLSFRLPIGMDPDQVERQVIDWLHQHDTGGCRWEIDNSHGNVPPFALSLDSPWVRAVDRAVQEMDAGPLAYIRSGGTIPLPVTLQNNFGIDTLLVGFGLNGDNIHSPDEHFGLDRFRYGCHFHALLLQQLGVVELKD